MTKHPIPKNGILDIKPYVPGKSVAAPGVRIMKLASNENPLGASPKAKAAYVAAADELHRYPEGTAAILRETIAKAYDIEAAHIVCGAGSDELIGLLIHAYAGVGDDILMTRHGFLMYKIYAQGFGVNVVMADEQNVTADVDALVAAVTPRTKIVFLANPNNPTGTYIPQSELIRLRNKIPEEIILVIDGAYAEYVTTPDYADGIEMVKTMPNVVVLRTFSKIFGLPALRIGWGYMPAHIADVLNRIRGPFNVSSAAQKAGAAAILDNDWIEKSRNHNAKWLRLVTDKLRALNLTVYDSVCNFVLVDFPAIGKHTAKEANAFLMNKGIIPREVAAYSLPNALRISIGTNEENEAMLTALTEFMKS